jgi:outer membrane protein assembly factor BamB
VAGTLTLTQDDTGLRARDSATGQQKWKTSVGIEDRTAHNLVVSRNTVVVTATSKPCYVEGGESDGHVVAFDLSTGAHLWSASDDTDADQVIVTDGRVIVSGANYATDPLVTAYRLSDGERVWSDGDNSDGARTFASMIPGRPSGPDQPLRPRDRPEERRDR